MRRYFSIFFVLFMAVTINAYAETPHTPRNFILALDMSGSMKGEGLTEIKRAANRFIENLPEDARLEIYTFDKNLRIIASLSSDRAELTRSISTIESGGDTALFDAIVALAPEAKSLNAPLIFFTDGRDSGSSKTPGDAEIATQGAPTSFISFQPRSVDFAILKKIAATSGGRILRVDQVDQLVSSFVRFATEVPTATPSSSPLPVQSKSEVSPRAPLALATGVSLFMLLFGLSLRRFVAQRDFYQRWDPVLTSYESAPIRTETSNEKRLGFIEPMRELATRFFGDTDLLFDGKRSSLFRLTQLTLLYLLLFIVWARTNLPLVLSFILATATFAFLLRFYIRQREVKRKYSFEIDLPTSLKMISASLSAGLSFLQALESFSRDNSTEVARQFRRALSEIQMGAPVEKALSNVATRIENKDLDWTIFAYSIQREVGGSLARILQTTAETIDARAELRREVRTLSAEGRISSYILMALPFGIFFFVLLTRPNFIAIFWRESIGHILLIVVGIFLTAAWFWIRKLVRIVV